VHLTFADGVNAVVGNRQKYRLKATGVCGVPCAGIITIIISPRNRPVMAASNKSYDGEMERFSPFHSYSDKGKIAALPSDFMIFRMRPISVRSTPSPFKMSRIPLPRMMSFEIE